MNRSNFMQATILNLNHSLKAMGVLKSDYVETFDFDLICSFFWLRSPLSYCCLAIFQINLETQHLQMTTRWLRIWLSTLLFTIFTLASLISPIAPPIPRFNVLSIFPCHAVLVSPQLQKTTSCSLNLEKNTEPDSMHIVLAVKINQRSAHIVHKARLVETQKLSSKSQQKHLNSQYKCHQRPPIIICGPTPLCSYTHHFSLCCCIQS